VINAFNLIDGIDGLTAGLGIVAALTVVVLAADNSAPVPVLGALALSGALSAFLRDNLPPARIFLGDSGAMGIGYVTAVLSIASYQKAPTAMVLIVPLLVLGVPILDVLLTVVRRATRPLGERGVRALHPLGIARAVMQADRGHIHHLLLRSGFTPRGVLFTLYALSIGFALLALRTREATPTIRWLVFFGLLGGALVALRLLERRVHLQEERAAAHVVVAPSPDEAKRVAASRGGRGR
jgi:UDP-GlcNAc:undecaprenyl-phosphate GlcNAc-1-phosphate transferase